ncbi:MAG: hypothetical protein R2777_04835 [Chitinophagales bacterium]
MKKWILRLLLIIVLCVCSVFIINYYVVNLSEKYIKNKTEQLDNAYTVIVLGARVYSNGNLSNYLKDRVENAYELYERKVKRFLLSGDHGTKRV